ncbi:chaplin family protein [Nocardiopsis sp. NPDC058631]|uniref:chaplin family protein n=1 Tax=Nocardiopsis sp. NPDC058631 TaxID=3346566 RepID=UPI00364FD8E0
MTHATQARIAALVTAGFIAATAAATAGTAYADIATSGNGSIGGGNQLVVDGDIPVNVCGNAIAILGLAGAQCTDSGASVTEGKSSTGRGPHGGYEEEEHESSEGETPGEESPKEENPGGESPKEENPGGGDPDEESSEGETPGQEVPEYQEESSEGGSVPVDEQAAPGGPGSSSEEVPALPGEQTSEQLSSLSSEPAASELAVTGADATGLFGLVAAAVAAVAAGVGLVVAGKRRRARV